MAPLDLTVIFLTVNRLPEKWVTFHRTTLLEAVGAYPLITVSAKPVDMPGKHLTQEPPFRASNIYFQMLRAAKLAETPYVAIAEDDSLYPREHFIKFRPQPDEFAYNYSRWSLFAWGEPTYYWTHRISNLTLVAPRDLLIQALEERFAKYPDGTPDTMTGELGRKEIERSLGLPQHKAMDFYTTIPVVNLNHTQSIDPYEQSMRKRRGFVRALDIPHWGHAQALQQKFV